MSNVIRSIDEIHDAMVWEYHVDLRGHQLEMIVGWSKKENGIHLCFDGLLAHHFENVIDTNILFDIEEVTLSYFLQKNEAFLKNKLRFGFPISRNDCRTIEQLKEYLQGYRFFQIDASLGMIGFIIARDIHINESKA